jgi:hypothetical protein
MTERFKISLSGMWLFICLFTLLIPVFLPSFVSSANPAANVVGAATTSMFILTFPSSLFGIPLLVFLSYALGVDPNSIGGMYLNLFVMFILGLVQWFWIVPRIWRTPTTVQVLDLPLNPEPLQLFCPADRAARVDDLGRTPLERVICDERENSR